ncbi:uncharacterized protein LOC123224756 isoform X4 [Mangifera indica]|uniref:uncharacterized protein LOC123224756 isoform X4 n=1 Tax=Mangifera indica TaxID=29780 RepID=UPI001CFAEAE2|nr:uncharacterized protein LOC123224756 isoform X4 [Mangifera indica]
MAQYDHQQAPGQVYPPAPPSPPQSVEGPYVSAPPPIGYPTKDDGGYPQHQPIENRSRGDDDFLKGWFETKDSCKTYNYRSIGLQFSCPVLLLCTGRVLLLRQSKPG